MHQSSQIGVLRSSAPEAPAKIVSKDLILAWARDRTSGEPRYILELTKDQRGQKCDCACYSCDLPLEAVNAGKTEYKIRPHFRHPDGAPKADCMVLTARAAALELLARKGHLLHLPSRRKSAQVEGLTGKYYDAWIDSPRETVCIHSAHFEDRAHAILTLDDGRQLRVVLVGSIEQDGSNEASIPTIRLLVNDPAVADMSPEDLRKRLTLIMDVGEWCSHWEDVRLEQQAIDAAKMQAAAALDWIDGDYDIPEGVSDELRRETLLHIKAKEILESEKRIQLPGLHINSAVGLPGGGSINDTSELRSQMVQLESIKLEKHLGPIKPDVYAMTVAAGQWPAQEILVEITVTNTIIAERLARIREKNLPTLEIDISRMGGVVSFEEFKRLIVDEIAGKHWLHHPWLVEEKARLDEKLGAVVNVVVAENEKKTTDRAQRKAALFRVPESELGQLYLRAVEKHSELRIRSEDVRRDEIADALLEIDDYAKALSHRGYPEALDNELFDGQGNILDRLMSIKLDKAVGYKLTTAWQVINAIFQEKPPHTQWQTLSLIAIKVYSPTLNDNQRSIVNAQRARVIDSLRAGDHVYRRTRKYDRFLSFLFPAMSTDLERPLPSVAPLNKAVPAPQGPSPLPSKLAVTLNPCKGEPKRSIGFERCLWETGPVILQDVSALHTEIICLGHTLRDQRFSTEEAITECCRQFTQLLHIDIIFIWADVCLVKQNIFPTDREYKDWKSRVGR